MGLKGKIGGNLLNLLQSQASRLRPNFSRKLSIGNSKEEFKGTSYLRFSSAQNAISTAWNFQNSDAHSI